MLAYGGVAALFRAIIFAPNEIAPRVIAVLQDSQAFDAIRRKARQTVIENYDLKTICLPAQLKMLEMAARRATAK